MSLDAVNRALHGVDFAKAEDASITRRAHRFLIGDGIYCSCTVFELSREELIECSELVYVLDQHVLEVHAIKLAESKIDVLPKIRWERHAAKVARGTTDSACSCYSELRFVLLARVEKRGQSIRSYRDSKPFS